MDLYPSQNLVFIQRRMSAIFSGFFQINFYYELSVNNKTIHLKKNCSHLDKLKTEIGQKRPEITIRNDIVLHEDNEWRYVSLITLQKIVGRLRCPTPYKIFTRYSTL